MDPELQGKFDAFKSALLGNADVLSVTRATHTLSGIYWNGSGWDWEARDPNVNPLVTNLGVGLDWLETNRIEMADGRFFTAGRSAKGRREVVVNETFAGIIGGDPVVGKWLTDVDDQGPEPFTIIGVVKDFHFKPVHQRVDPLIIRYLPDYSLWKTFVRVADRDVQGAVASIKETYHRFRPDHLFEYTFVEDEYEEMYSYVQARSEIFFTFAALAVFISAMGLFGLASYITETRSREIGIRKVFGASAPGVVALLTKDFIRWVLAANVIALPIAYLLSRRWLEGFPYRAELGARYFVAAALLSLLVAAATVSFRAVRAALANPVDAIRYE
jgi:putative ABC transport system permease protein